jgi:hypothetical protein
MTDSAAASPQDKNAPGQDASPERLARLLAQLNKYEEGKSVAAYAADNHITLRFANPQSAEDSHFVEGNNARYDHRTKTVMLNPRSSDDTLLSDLPHEVWHGDQDKRGITKVEGQLRNPTQRIALHNITEAAAYTEQALDGVPFPKDEMQRTKDTQTLADLRALYDGALKRHETPEAARLGVFKAALKYTASRYEGREFDDLVNFDNKLNEVKGFKDDDLKRAVVGQEGAELSPKALADVIRRSGNMDLSPSARNFFSSMTDADIAGIVQLTTSQLSPLNTAMLEATQGTYNDLRRQIAPKTR